MLDTVFLMLAGYAVGSIPNAYLAVRLTRNADIRRFGDGNPGAANAWRLLGPVPGSLVFFADLAKGAAAVGIAYLIVPGDTGAIIAGIAAVVGHNWPFYLHFHGGRGAAASLGVLCTLIPFITIPIMVAALIILKLTRSTVLTLAFIYIPLPIVSWIFGASAQVIWFSLGLPALVGISHFVSELLWSPQAIRAPSEASPRA